MGLSTNRLLQVQLPPVVCYYSSLALDGKLRSLIFTIGRTEFAICATVHFLPLARDYFPETFRLDERTVVFSGCLVVIVDELADLVNQIRIWSIIQ